MDPGYQNVVETRDLVWTLVAYVLHGGSVFVQLSLVGFLVGTGLHDVLRPDRAGRWLRRFGALAGAVPHARVFGAVRIGLGLLLLAPLAVGAPSLVSLGAGVASFLLLLRIERAIPVGERRVGRLVRRTSIGFAALAALFMMWEGEDNLTLAADVVVPAMEWRGEELGWQLEQDPQSPKLGDLAPDFELQDPDGVTRVRLSDFRGKRPVALVFGSYT